MPYHHGSLRNTLVEKGLVLLHEQGAEGVSLRKVAALCGVSHTAPYKHFKSKEELLAAIYDASARMHIAIPPPSPQDSPDPRAHLLEIAKRYVSFCLYHPDYLRAQAGSSHAVRFREGTLHYGAASPFRNFYTAATEYLKQEQPRRKDRATWALALWSLLQGIAFSLSAKTVEAEGDKVELAGRMVESLLETQMKK